jgi:hypothetical protein
MEGLYIKAEAGGVVINLHLAMEARHRPDLV